jgi:hypothetical protein
MAYFSNGDSADRYEAEYCANCVHENHETGCPVFNAHILFSSELCNQKEHPGKVILDMLIPEHPTECRNEQCAMFFSRDGALPGQRQLFGEKS